jgi:hypothetical protein
LRYHARAVVPDLVRDRVVVNAGIIGGLNE